MSANSHFPFPTSHFSVPKFIRTSYNPFMQTDNVKSKLRNTLSDADRLPKLIFKGYSRGLLDCTIRPSVKLFHNHPTPHHHIQLMCVKREHIIKCWQSGGKAPYSSASDNGMSAVQALVISARLFHLISSHTAH